MPRRNTLVFIIVLIVFALALSIVVPISKGILGNRGIRLGLDLQGGIHMVYEANLSLVEPDEKDDALEGAKAVLENRVNPMGVTEPVIQIQGNDRILVELPGLSITDKEKERLGRVDILRFGELVTEDEEAEWENELGRWKPATAIINGEEKTLSSRYFKENTYISRDERTSEIALIFEWDEGGSELSKEITGRLIDKPLGIFEGSEALRGDDERPIAPFVQTTIVSSGRITGLSLNDATRLSKQLNYGRLPVPLEVIYDQTVSPILGADFIDMSVKAGLIGIVLVMLFMILYYRLPGLMASLALVFYGTLVLAVFKLWPGGGVTLTLAGIGGFVLSIGMAVDANVLIFERMKEEIRDGRTLGAAIETGFDRAWTAIRDSNVTTLIVCAILLWLGNSIVASAPVVAFAWALAIGVTVSMLTAIVVTRTLLRLFVGTRLAKDSGQFKIRIGPLNIDMWKR
ncbi:protein translocase subunit SecD [Chloroflexota bacterium]